jgi:hypothetical protein
MKVHYPEPGSAEMTPEPTVKDAAPESPAPEAG